MPCRYGSRPRARRTPHSRGGAIGAMSRRPLDDGRRRMTGENYKKRTIDNRPLHPETLMMGYGYSPRLSEGALKPPIFLTSTFAFETAQQGKDLFDVTSGRRRPRRGQDLGLVYSRFNNPNFEILEDRLAVW